MTDVLAYLELFPPLDDDVERFVLFIVQMDAELIRTLHDKSQAKAAAKAQAMEQKSRIVIAR